MIAATQDSKKPTKQKKEKAVRRLFLALERMIEATDAAKAARDELVKIGGKRPEK